MLHLYIDGLTHLHKMTREKYERGSKLSVSVSYMLINLCVTILHLLLLNRGEHQTLVPQPWNHKKVNLFPYPIIVNLIWSPFTKTPFTSGTTNNQSVFYAIFFYMTKNLFSKVNGFCCCCKVTNTSKTAFSQILVLPEKRREKGGISGWACDGTRVCRISSHLHRRFQKCLCQKRFLLEKDSMLKISTVLTLNLLPAGPTGPSTVTLISWLWWFFIQIVLLFCWFLNMNSCCHW